MDEIPNMDLSLRDEINKLNKNQLSTLFWQSYGWMRVEHFEEITKAIESAMIDVRKEYHGDKKQSLQGDPTAHMRVRPKIPETKKECLDMSCKDCYYCRLIFEGQCSQFAQLRD